ncbi:MULTISPECIES: ABC transporter ATP-binding protein [Shouchella]|uniref:ABC transporter ATP-binding protein n=1 Tax=Shouchella clausii TaxID=79880 RepID=A0A268S1M1_SHOCL|nr:MULTISPECIES: ABC transporter ATP-binding protein [Shouchella]PAD42781.1 ABC transporter ATP-binding protein [Bacillus sp. 7520-S]SPU22380.1 multidrug ABC transporter ATP-binding protein [Niallia circulans]AST98332.1 export ABC transporter ATP-binding protein [Shouchella clausii]KKI88093.1 antibiotic ABC transporter ATP-binding protein [Shouchella clausii]MBU8597551.1 ABC transporter ATP-binding protein [Shouchella clausii]
MLETIQLSKSFKGKKAVQNVSLYLDHGESVGLIGPNGAGKSTTISMISTLIKPTAGEIRLKGMNVVDKPGEMRKVLGIVPQELALYEELSAYENLKFFGSIYKIRNKDLEGRIQQALEIVGLADRRKELVRTFSGGMKRRMNIAAALLHQPQILILDEPTVGIDPQSRNHILETVRMLNEKKGTTVLYTSHYMEEVEQLCDRLYIMDHGEVIASGTKAELLSILSTEDTIKVELSKGEPGFVEQVKALNGIREVEGSHVELKMIAKKGSNLISELVHLAEQHRIQIINFHTETPSLEDVFLHLTGRRLRD